MNSRLFATSLGSVLAATAIQAQVFHELSTGPLTQNWSDAGLISTTDDWSAVPSIRGYRGDDLTTVTGTDPQTILGDGSSTPIDVNANNADPNTFTSGGITEFDSLADPVVAFQGSGTADAPHFVFFLNALGVSNISVSYDLRDIDGSADNSVQAVALQYRIGSSGDYTNLPDGFVADASTGPGLASAVTSVSVTLPGAANNQSEVFVRVITSNAIGSDEWIGVDNIAISATAVPEPHEYAAVAGAGLLAFALWRRRK